MFPVATACLSCSPRDLNSAKLIPLQQNQPNYFTTLLSIYFIYIYNNELFFYQNEMCLLWDRIQVYCLFRSSIVRNCYTTKILQACKTQVCNADIKPKHSYKKVLMTLQRRFYFTTTNNLTQSCGDTQFVFINLYRVLATLRSTIGVSPYSEASHYRIGGRSFIFRISSPV